MATVASNVEKYASEYPLPGGVERYFDTLVGLLTYIRDGNVSPEDLSNWIFSTFPSATGQIAVNGYIATLGRMGLWMQQGDLIRLTPEGTAVVTKAVSAPDEARRIVIEIKCRVFLGYDVLFQFLVGGVKTLDEIHEHLKSALHVNWKSKNQSSFRVNWLRSVGYVEKDGTGYRLSSAGLAVWNQLKGKVGTHELPPTQPPVEPPGPVQSSLFRTAVEIADRLDKMAVIGGNGKDFEEATEVAFKFLGFDTQLISGSGNPDVLATAAMGVRSYRVLIDSKSRTSGVVQQNDVNFQVMEKQRQAAAADYVVIVGKDFAGGNLEEFAEKNKVRLLSTSDLRELLLAHADSVLPLDVLQPLFQGGGKTDEGVLSEVVNSAESKADVTTLARKVYAAVRQFQGQEGAIHTDSLYYILKTEHSLPTIRLTVEFLKSDLIAALGETEQGSLYTRISPTSLNNKINQIAQALDLKDISTM